MEDWCAGTPLESEGSGIVIDLRFGGGERNRARVTETNGGQIRPVLGRGCFQHAGRRRGAQSVFAPLAHPELLVLYNLVALGLANANSYLWNTLWTFRHQARHDAKQVSLFTAQGLLNAGVGSLLLWLTAHGLGAYTGLSPLVSDNVAKVASMVVASTLSFIFLRFFVFRSRKA